MGNKQYTMRNGRADGRSSLGNFSTKDGVQLSFGTAFRNAHSAGGWGHTFTYNNKLYTTDCRDGGDYRKEKEKDTRSYERHLLR